MERGSNVVVLAFDFLYHMMMTLSLSIFNRESASERLNSIYLKAAAISLKQQKV